MIIQKTEPFKTIDMADKGKFTNSIYQSQISDKEKDEALYKKKVKMLRTDDRFIAYFKQFDPASVNTFIENYAQRWVQWQTTGKTLRGYEMKKKDDWMKGCIFGLKAIQQKKFFNLQCHWRAEKIKLEGFEICYDFNYWQRDILSCKVIPPITSDEVELYVRFLQEYTLDEKFDLDDMPDYTDVKRAYKKVDDEYGYDPWYHFFDEEMGTAYLMDLPDLRGEKEDVYDDLARKEEQDKEKERREEWERTRDKRPYLKYYEGDFKEKFIKEFESPTFYRLYKEVRRKTEIWDMNDEVETKIWDLDKDPRRNIAMEAAEDWRTAIKRTFERYRRERVIALMPTTYQQYLDNLGKKWKYPTDEHENKMFTELGKYRKLYYDRIIRGRELKGEPADLNF